MSVAADALGVARLGAACAFPGSLAAGLATPEGSWTPLLLFGLAAATDFTDGVLARRLGAPSRHGAVLDVVADVAFVLGATGAAAWLGLVSPVVPLCIAAAVVAYAGASLRGTRRAGRFALARSGLGHAAGVLNYALAGLAAGAVALPGEAWSAILRLGSVAVVAANLGAVLSRLLPD